MRAYLALLSALLVSGGVAAPFRDQVPLRPLEDTEQTPLQPTKEAESTSRGLKGRFLHITDLHPDPFFKYHSSTAEEDACHRGNGPAGYYGAETSDCDSPLSLINATFEWISENLRDEVDFVIWTGDSARHDNDEAHPRTESQITSLNEFTVSKFLDAFGSGTPNSEDPLKALAIPIVPTWGNNDILPHNVFFSGPNRWTRKFLSVWRHFIPEEQRHSFAVGGWFYVEVIPNHLAVFSLNSLYFFEHNSAVDGCATESEPGYEQFEWLRIQLQFMRQRGMKAILIGHVPPARTQNKQSWDETCWQKYTLWMQQYRDVVVTSLWGHMNTDHFLLHDTKEIDLGMLNMGGQLKSQRTSLDEEMTIQSNREYFTDLRNIWADLPLPTTFGDAQRHGQEFEEYKEKIGGEWGERYSLSLVSPSVVPNYFPTLRIVSYDVSSIGAASTQPNELTNRPARARDIEAEDNDDEDAEPTESNESNETDDNDALDEVAKKKKRKNKKHKKKHAKKPNFKQPKGPSKSSPPGPAYSPQPLTLLSYRQLFANLTHINNDFPIRKDEVASQKWKSGKHADKHPPTDGSSPSPHPFKFELEYDTAADDIYNLPDMTVKSYLELAKKIGMYKAPKSGSLAAEEGEGAGGGGVEEDEAGALGKKKDKKNKKKKRRARRNRPWLTFVRRAFMGSKDDGELHEDFGEEFAPN